MSHPGNESSGAMSHQGNESCEDLHTALPRCLLFPLCPVALPPPHPPPPLHPWRLAQHEALQESLTDEMVGMAAALKASTLSVQDAVRCLPGLGGGGWVEAADSIKRGLVDIAGLLWQYGQRITESTPCHPRSLVYRGTT